MCPGNLLINGGFEVCCINMRVRFGQLHSVTCPARPRPHSTACHQRRQGANHHQHSGAPLTVPQLPNTEALPTGAGVHDVSLAPIKPNNALPAAG
jgi:hypothetical protein